MATALSQSPLPSSASHAQGTPSRNARTEESQATTVDGEDALLITSLDDVRLFAQVLKSINFVDIATCHMLQNGLKFVVEDAKCMQAKAFFKSSMFNTFQFASEDGVFRIDLEKCLYIFGGSNQTTMRMKYVGQGNPLVLELEDTGVVTDCSLRTLVTEENIDIDMRASNITSNIIMKSDWLADVFGELDTTSELLQVYISPDAPNFRLSTAGNAGSWELDCPQDSEVIEVFTCQQTSVYSYKLKFIKRFEKTLAISKKISIRVNDLGTMSMQFLVPTDTDPIFVEFLCLPEVDAS